MKMRRQHQASKRLLQLSQPWVHQKPPMVYEPEIEEEAHKPKRNRTADKTRS